MEVDVIDMEIVWFCVSVGSIDVVVMVEVEVKEKEIVWLWVIAGGTDVVIIVEVEVMVWFCVIAAGQT